jgi:hypothetical protein
MFTKTSKKPNDAFAFFKQAVNEIFQPLFTEFGFRHFETLEYMPDCVLKYRNESTGLNLRYEWNSQISISLVKLDRTESEVTEASTYDLLFLLKIRQPSIDINTFHRSDKKWTDAYIERLLREYETLLRQNARDVLTGDFGIFPELKRVAAEHRRNWNKETFGTSTGESPRFTSRPTLQQVFEDAKEMDPELDRLFGGRLNQDKTATRIYEAYWDHQFSIREIADYLNESEESVHRQLEEYDDRG